MIHIVITVSAGNPARLTYHHFETKGALKNELQVAHTLRTFLIPFLTRIARGANLRIKVIE